MEECFFAPGEYIIKENLYDNGFSNAIYFIIKGNVELFYDFKRDDMEEEVKIKKVKLYLIQ